MNGRRTATRELVVRLEGIERPIGVLEGFTGDGGHRIRFTYAEAYRGSALSAALPPRAAPYENAEARTYFDNLLPEGEARRAAVDEGGRPFDEDDVAGLLSALGGECPGAVMILPPDAPPPKRPGVLSRDYELLTDDEVARLLRDVAAGRRPGDLERASLPGVQRKIALAYDPRAEAFLRPRSRAVPTTHLLKVAPAKDPRFEGVVANEALCMRVAGMLGLPVADTERVVFDDVETLSVRRYDRAASDDGAIRRLHQEDAAQALGLDRSLKYEDEARKAGRGAGFSDLLGRFCALTDAPADARDVLRRGAFANWLMGNNDAHMKNFSLLHRADGGAPRLAPLYDVVSVEALPGGWTKMAMAMNGTAMAPAVGRAGIEWLAALDPSGRKAGASVLRRRMGAFREMAARALGAIEDVVADDVVCENEAKPVRDLVSARLAILNRELGWDLPG